MLYGVLAGLCWWLMYLCFNTADEEPRRMFAGTVLLLVGALLAVAQLTAF
jgi:hypothetical protein